MVSNQSYNKLAYMHSEQERQLLAHRVTIINLFWKRGWEETQALREQDGRKYISQFSCSWNSNFKFFKNFFAINLGAPFYLSLKNMYLILKATFLLCVLHFGN